MMHTYEDWTEKLKQELKTDDFSSKLIKLKNGITFDPMMNPETEVFSQKMLNIPEIFTIGHCLIGDNDLSINKGLQVLLSQGLSGFRVKATAITDWNTIFENIYLNMVFTDIEAEREDGLQKFIEFISAKDKSLKENISVQLIGQNTIDVDGYFKVYDFHHDKIEEQRDTLKKIHNILSKRNHNKIKLRIRVGDDLFDTLPFIRAIKILESEYFKGERLVIEANCELKEITKDPAERLISASVIAMWCKMSGADQLYFDQLNVTNELEHARQLLNIQNLFTHEVKMDTGKDPFKGAYIIESLTHKILAGLNK